MWLHRFTSYILANRWQTVALVFLATFVPILGVIGILIVALVTLRKSVIDGAVMLVAATIPHAIVFYFSAHYRTAPPMVMWVTLGVAVLSNVATWVFAVMLRQRSSWSQILQVAALFGVLVISVVHLSYPAITEWWGEQLQAYYSQSLPGLLKTTQHSSELQLETIKEVKQYATGLIVVAILLDGFFQLILARWWESIIFRPRGLGKELQTIRLSSLAGILFVAGLVMAYLGNTVVLDIMPVLYLLFGAAGLSLIHYVFTFMKSPNAWFWMLVLYLLLIFSLPVSIEMVAILALFDIWFDIRGRFRKLDLR